ncbi:MAG: hypothetical protein WBD40_03560 [Tepidisphaeraceae bacterium]
MIYNATLQSIATISGADVRGKQTYAAPVTVNVRCSLQEFVTGQRIDPSLLALVTDSTAQLYVPAGTSIAKDQRLVVLPDGGAAAVTLVVRHATPWVHGSQSHTECFAREIPA